MSDDGRYGGHGLPEGYEPGDDELSEYKYAILSLLHGAEFVTAGTTDIQPKYGSDAYCFVFDHPDFEGGIMIPVKLSEMDVIRAVSRSDGGWTPVEDVGVFDELPDWVNHSPSELSDDPSPRREHTEGDDA